MTTTSDGTDPPPDGAVLFLLHARTGAELDILQRWVSASIGSAECLRLPHPRATEGTAGADRAAFRRRLARDDDPDLHPLRVVWLPPEHDGQRRARVRDVVLGDPRHPNERRQRRLAQSADAYQVVVAEPARLHELRARFEASSAGVGGDAFELFVARQAVLALERAEYRIVGANYKVPRLVREEISTSARFADGVARLAAELGRTVADVHAEAIEDLNEMAAGYSRLLIDAMSQLGDFICRPGYGDQIDYAPEQVELVKELFDHHPVVVMPSHKSQLDGAVIPRALRDNGLPPTHIFAGINMSMGPFAVVFRRMGRIFIRRSTREDPVYRWVLREYVGYLLEKRFHLEWYIEGTRSRTGKLMPPKLGLVRYVVDAYLEGRSDDVMMLPVSIMYDELHEIADYAREARGGTKQAEGLGWAVRYYRAQRRKYGRIYVRFGEPVSLNQALGGYAEATEDERRIMLHKLAFEVCTRINDVTPITGSALLSQVLLATRGRALTISDIYGAMGEILGQARRRNLPLADSAQRLGSVEGLADLTASLVANGTFESFDGGAEPVFRVAPGRELTAAFYRNTAIHYFIGGAIGEVALLKAAESPADPTETFWNEVFEVRDVLKFDFFFAEKDDFRKQVAEQLSGRVPDWEHQLAVGHDPAELRAALQPLTAFAVLRPFIEAYGVVARVLTRSGLDEEIEEKECVAACLGLGTQLMLQGSLRTEEAVSKILFGTGYQLAAHRGLTRPGPDLAARRAAFADELLDITRRIDLTERLTYAAANRSITVVGQ